MADVVSIRPGQLGAFVKRSAGKNLSAVREGLRRGLERGRAVLVKASPVDQGILKNAWKVLAAPDFYNLFNDAPHAGIVERGARPHLPPLEPILEWVVRHLRNFGVERPRFRSPKQGPLRSEAAYARRSTSLARHMSEVADFEDEVLAIARAIQLKILKKGLPPTYFVRSSLPKLRDLVAEEVEKALARALGKS